jgi:hypothetical protein
MMDQLVRQMVMREFPDCVYLSEEGMATVYPDPGDVFAWCDPLDGTTNAFTMFSGYAVVLFFEQWTGNRFEHLAGAIASADGTVVSWHRFRGSGDVYIDWPEDFSWPSQTQAAETHRSTTKETNQTPRWQTRLGPGGAMQPHAGVLARVAAVAGTPNRLSEVHLVYDVFSPIKTKLAFQRRWLATVAGNPYIAPLLVGDLGAIIEPREVTMYDAVYLIPLVLAGGHVYSLVNRNEIDPLQIFSLGNPLTRTMGPFLASVSPNALEQLRADEEAFEE